MILGIDQGTTGSTAILLDESGHLLASHTAAVPQHFPKPGWVEHDPEEIWVSVESAVRGCLEKAKRSSSDIHAIGITNQRETLSLFDHRRALHRFIVWQDRRTSADCRRLDKHMGLVRKISGTPIDPYFSSTKIRWLLKQLKIRRASQDLRFRTIDSYLLQRLCGEDAMECSNAHRTQLLDLRRAVWSDRLLDVFQVPKSLCPPIIPSEGFSFKTQALGFLPKGIPVVAALGDQQAALFGQGAWKKGAGKITYGTGSFILIHTGDTPVVSKRDLVSTIALQPSSGKTQYALEGSVFVCGAWVQWLRDQLGMISTSAEIEALARESVDSDGVLVVPALTGLGAPFWRASARGLIAGLTRGSHRGHIAYASIEGLAFQNRALIDSLKDEGIKLRLSNWRVDGGAAKNNLLLEIQSQLLNAVVLRPKNLEATATGVAYLAGLSKKHWSLSDIEKLWELDQKFEPQKSRSQKLERRYQEWRRLAELS
jgi:glycerol kinase